MACGPALAGFLQINFKIYALTINQNALPGWVMSLAWFMYLFWLWISFREPEHNTEEEHFTQSPDSGQGKNDELEDGLAQPLLVDANERQDEDGDDCDDSEEASEESGRPATSIASAYRLLTPSVKQLPFQNCYFMEFLICNSQFGPKGECRTMKNWTSQLKEHLSNLGRQKHALISQSPENMQSGFSMLLSSVASVSCGSINLGVTLYGVSLHLAAAASAITFMRLIT